MARGAKQLAPYDTEEAIHERVAEAWDLRGNLPIPRWDVMCPCCFSSLVQFKAMTFFRRKRPNNPYRCDVDFKCRACSMVWRHGVAISQMMFEARTVGHPGAYYDWKAIRALLVEDKDAPTEDGVADYLYEASNATT